MNDFTRKQFNILCTAIAEGYGIPSVKEQFAVTPVAEQRLQDKIVEQSEFLQKINVITVSNMTGENVLVSDSGPVSGRTDTSDGTSERVPKDALNMENFGYELFKTNSDVALRYAQIDAWAHMDNLIDRYPTHVQRRIANDRELIGWNGKEAVPTTDISANPLLQDVNKGWIQYMRDKYPANILKQGEKAANEIRIGPGGDYENLDLAVNDMLQGIPLYLRAGLVLLVGDELVSNERAALLATVGGKPTEKNAMNAAMTTIGGLEWDTPTNFPPRGIVITSYDNLSVYVQKDSWRRQIKDKPSKDRIEDFNSRNEGYTVEEPRKFIAAEFDNVKLPDGAGGWQ